MADGEKEKVPAEPHIESPAALEPSHGVDRTQSLLNGRYIHHVSRKQPTEEKHDWNVHY